MPFNHDFDLTFLGHSAFHLRTPGGLQVLIDPWLKSNPLCPPEWHQPPAADLVLITHAHFDHAQDALDVLRGDTTLIGTLELCAILEQRGASHTSSMNVGGSQHFRGLAVTMTPAIHTCGYVDADGSVLYAGLAVGYVVTLEDGFRIYHAGDTAVFGDMSLIHDLYHPDLAILPIGDHFTMGPLEAAMAAQLLQVPRLVPMHYGTFPALTGTVEALREALGPGSPYTVFPLNPGERLS